MTEPQPATSPTPITPAPSSGVFGTKIPSTVTFAVGILLFFTPFIEIRCNSMTIQSVSGVQLATGFKVDRNNGAAGYFSDLGKDAENKPDQKVNKEKPNIYAALALLFAVLGLVLSIARSKGAGAGGMISGILTVAALIGLLIDVGNKIKMEFPKNGEQLDFSIGLTSWFYVTIIVFVAAAFFSYKRLMAEKTG